VGGKKSPPPTFFAGELGAGGSAGGVGGGDRLFCSRWEGRGVRGGGGGGPARRGGSEITRLWGDPNGFGKKTILRFFEKKEYGKGGGGSCGQRFGLRNGSCCSTASWGQGAGRALNHFEGYGEQFGGNTKKNTTQGGASRPPQGGRGGPKEKLFGPCFFLAGPFSNNQGARREKTGGGGATAGGQKKTHKKTKKTPTPHTTVWGGFKAGRGGAVSTRGGGPCVYGRGQIFWGGGFFFREKDHGGFLSFHFLPGKGVPGVKFSPRG